MREPIERNGHTVRFLQDDKYDHLYQPQCTCGARHSGFSAYPDWWVEEHFSKAAQ